MACADYTGLLRWVYDWQTLLAGGAAIVGGGLAYWAGVKQANATKEQTAALEQQNAELKLADQRKLARERFAVAGLLYTALGYVVAQIQSARSMLGGAADVLVDEGGNIRHIVENPSFPYLWERLRVFEGAIVAGFLNLEIAIGRMRTEKGPTSIGQLKEQLDNLSRLADSLRNLASGEMQKAKAELSP